MDESELSLIEEGLSYIAADADSDDIAARLEQFGWFALFEDEPGTAIRLLFGQQGKHGSNSLVVPLLMALAVGDPVATMVRAEPNTALVLPPLGTSTPPATTVCSTDLIDVDGVVVGAQPQRLLVVADLGTRHEFGEVLLGPDAVQPAGGLDPNLGLRRVAGRGQFTPLPLGAGGDPLAAWREAVTVGRLGLASELTGIAGRVLGLSVDYVGSRHQFGRALGTFQAVQHLLAEVEVELTVARSAVLEAASAGDALTAMLAKLLAGRAAMRAVARAQQVLGGIGFTWEHGLHRDVRRVAALESLLGSTASLERETGTLLCETRAVPEVAQL